MSKNITWSTRKNFADGKVVFKYSQLLGYRKGENGEPEIVPEEAAAVYDEIGTEEELKKVSESFCAGVTVITTAHIGSAEELMRRRVTAALIESGAVSKIALLPRIHSATIKIIPRWNSL